MAKKTKLPIEKGLYFLPLGGCGKFGMNLAVYALNGKFLIVDMGLSFSSIPGQELLLADPTFLIENKERILGVVITHMHEDHIGAVPYILPMLGNVPVYITPMGKDFLREKLTEFDLQDTIKILATETGTPVSIGEFEIKFINITHSVPDSNCVLITTPYGKIVHTGDWNLDPKPLTGKPLSKKQMLELIGERDNKPLALVCDSTSSHKQAPSIRESSVRTELVKLIKSLKGHRVIFSCFSSNIARIESCAIAAKKAGRKTAIFGRSIKRIELIARKHGYLEQVDSFLEDKAVASQPPEKTVIICTGSQGEQRSALSKLADDSHPRLKLGAGDVVVFSARIIPGNEKPIIDLQNRLVDKGVRIITPDLLPIHASGHPSREELKQLYEWLSPDILIPVHGDLINLFEHAQFAKECGIKNAIVPRNGLATKIATGKPENLKSFKAQNGMLAVDGNILVPTNGAMQKEKVKIMREGIVFITLSETDIKNRPYEICEMTFVGLFEPQQSALQQKTRHTIEKIFNEMLAQRDKSKDLPSSVENITKNAVRKAFNSIRNKKPTVIAHVLELF